MVTQIRPREFAPVAAQVQQALAEHDLPSAAVAVAIDGEIRWEEAFGWADRARRIPATTDSLYSLASISKLFTVTACMMLIERGLLGLDEPVNTYLGQAGVTARVGDARLATLRRLANHTSGLPLHYHYFYEDQPERPPPLEETTRRYGLLVTAPGERTYYANLGYAILGHLIACSSGMSFEGYMRQEVLFPLGLRHTSVWAGGALEPLTVRQYGADGVAYPKKVSDHPAAGNIYASIHDVIRFALFHLKQLQPDQRVLLRDETIDAMQRPTARAEEHGFGVGWMTYDDLFGYRVIGHDGSSGGVATQLFLVPDEGIAVAVLVNSSRPNPVLPLATAHGVLGVLLPGFAAGLAAERARQSQPAPAPTDGFVVPEELAGRWEGTIHTPEGQVGCSLLIGRTIEATVQGNTAPVSDAAFTAGVLGGTVPLMLPARDAQRRPHHLLLDLHLRGDVLNGAVVAQAPTGPEGGAPSLRLGFALSHWTELERRS